MESYSDDEDEESEKDAFLKWRKSSLPQHSTTSMRYGDYDMESGSGSSSSSGGSNQGSLSSSISSITTEDSDVKTVREFLPCFI